MVSLTVVKIYDNMSIQSIFYVGTSRTKNALEIVILQSDDELKELAIAVSGGISRNKSAIASTLKVKLVKNISG